MGEPRVTGGGGVQPEGIQGPESMGAREEEEAGKTGEGALGDILTRDWKAEKLKWGWSIVRGV